MPDADTGAGERVGGLRGFDADGVEEFQVLLRHATKTVITCCANFRLISR